MKSKLKNYYYNSRFGHYLLYIPQKIWNKYRIIRDTKLSDKELIQIKYKEFLSKNVNLENPKLFTEKIQWLKLNDRRDTYTLCADKYLVRNYVEEKIGSKYLIPLVSITENYNDINENNLPLTLTNLFPAYQAGDVWGLRLFFLHWFVRYQPPSHRRKRQDPQATSAECSFCF